MPEPESFARRPVSDSETEFSHDEAASGRRHRQIADWGGDDLFTRMPRRRSGHDGGQRSRRVAATEAAEADRAPETRRRPADDWGLDLPPAASPAGAADSRAVVIGRSERPSPAAPFVPVTRRRPPRTLAERIGGRPEQIVAWAFALGLILIAIAIATAHA